MVVVSRSVSTVFRRPGTASLQGLRCADVICDFCGYLAQVKTTERTDVDTLPRALMGSACGPQKERMDAGIYFPLFIMVTNTDWSTHPIYYLPADLQHPEMFQQR